MRLFHSLRETARRLREDSQGNVLIMMAALLIPMLFAVGMGIDYGRAQTQQTRMNAAADAAALAGTNATLMQQSTDTALAAARQIFISQVSGLQDIQFNAATDLNVSLVDTGALNSGRTIVVSYTAKSVNLFGGILGYATLPIAGSSTANAAQAPHINFFLTMDKSPSMLLPSTSSGLTSIRNATGCAFACHAQDPRADGINIKTSNSRDVFLNGNYYNSGNTGYKTWYQIDSSKNLYDQNGTKIGTSVSVASNRFSFTYKDLSNKSQSITGFYADGYWLTHNYTTLYPTASPIPLRIGAETLAAQDLIPFAQNMATKNNVTYKMQVFSFDWTHPGYSTPVTTHTSMTDVQNMTTSNIPDLDSTTDFWYANGKPTSSTNINDKATEFNNMLTAMNSTMPNPGDGTTTAKPQEVLFIITDGVTDEQIGSSRWNRELTTAHLNNCTTIKNRGIKIAILYTEYLPDALTGDSWSQSNVAPYLGNVLPALQKCASAARDGTPLVYTVSTDQSISDALTALFALTIQSAHLVK